MNVLHETAASLRELADKIDQSGAKINELVKDTTLSHAIGRVRAVLGDKTYKSIEMNIVDSHGEIAVRWSVYDGNSHHKGPTLEVALNAFLSAHAKPEAEPIESAQDVFNQANSELLPL